LKKTIVGQLDEREAQKYFRRPEEMRKMLLTGKLYSHLQGKERPNSF